MKKGIDYIGVGVGAIIVNHDGAVFLARRGREARNESGKWEFPGGGVEFNETLEEAVAREVMEEYGFEIFEKETAALSTKRSRGPRLMSSTKVRNQYR